MRDFTNAKELVSVTPYEEMDLAELKERRLYLNGYVDNVEALFDGYPHEDVVTGLAYYILKYNREDKGLPVEERKPIILYINSPGGSVINGYVLVDTILASKTPVYTVNFGECASMGFLIFLAGHKRFSLPRAQYLLHDGGLFSGYESTAKARDRMDFNSEKLEPMTKEYVLSRTTISPELYDENYRVEWYMLPEEAKEYGIVHSILSVDCDIDDII